MRGPVSSAGRRLWPCLLLCLACEKSASLGTMCADRKTRCEEVKVDDATYYAKSEGARGAFDEYPAIEPAWTRSESSDGGALADGSRLSAGEPGSLWIFEPTAQGVRVLDVDEAGELRELALLAQPVSVRENGELSMQLTFDAPDPRGPLLVVRSWPEIPCPKKPPTPQKPSRCYGYDQQILVFDADPSAPPRRTTPPPGLLASRDGNIVRANSGDDLFAADRALTRYDARGGVRWTQASAMQAQAQNELRAEASVPAAAIAALAGDRVAYLPFAGQLQPPHQSEYWLLDGSGAVLKAHVVPAFNLLLRTALFHSPSGDALIAADTRGGDLVLMSIHADDSLWTFTVPREDYTFQELHGASMDSVGTLYAATRAGGDEPEELHTLLCRLVAGREGGCFRVADVPPIVDIQGTTPNVLYTLSRDGSLRRFELPE